MNTEIICYCNETQFDMMIKYCEEYKLTNVTIKVSNLKDYPNSQRMIDIKSSNSQRQKTL